MTLQNNMDLEGCRVEIEKAPKKAPGCIFQKAATFPQRLLKSLKNTVLLVKHKELREPARRNLCPMKIFSSFDSLPTKLKMVTHPVVMSAFMKHFRIDPENGFFSDEVNSEMFLPLLRDLYPDETICENDFLLTCQKDRVIGYRHAILQFIGPQKIRGRRNELHEIAKTFTSYLQKQGQEINATKMANIYSTTVISNLLLGHPGPFDTYLEIANAVDVFNLNLVKKAWKMPIPKKEKEQYQEALKVIRQAVETSLEHAKSAPSESFIEVMQKEKQFSEIQIKSMLMLMYFAGSETTSTVINYILWQLGQHPKIQEELYESIKHLTDEECSEGKFPIEVERVFYEALRMHSSGYLISRKPFTDLLIRIRSKEGEVIFEEVVEKKWLIATAPTFAGRDPDRFENPDEFNPHRFKEIPSQFSWHPFGEGRHSCPGQWLAKEEVCFFLVSFCKAFKFTSTPKEGFRQMGYITLKPDRECFLTLEKRDS